MKCFNYNENSNEVQSMNYKFIWPLALTIALTGCTKKSATTETTQNTKTETTETTASEPDKTTTTTTLSDEAKKAAESYVSKGSPAALFFYADWCPACRAFKPTVEEVEAKYPNVKVIRLNVDEQKDITKAFKISSIPSLFFFDKDGNFIESTTGGLASEKLQEEFNKISTGGDSLPVTNNKKEEAVTEPKTEGNKTTNPLPEKPKTEPAKKP
jgi:thioredoxin 1